MSGKVAFRVIGMLEDGRLLLDNEFTMSGVSDEVIKHTSIIVHELPVLVVEADELGDDWCPPGIPYVFKEDLMKCGRFEEWVKE